MAITALEAAPDEISFALKRQAEVTNMPRVGYDGNYAYPTMQANFAASQRSSALACTCHSLSSYPLSDAPTVSHLKKDFGSFGGKHVDENDCPGGFTCMITYSDVAPGEHPGMFIVGDLGVFVGTRLHLLS